jgi:threonine/homoserine/homoserine lactone efflux protein
MTYYLSLILFTVSTCGTPGPNNIMIMSSGVNYGFRKSIPHVIGINIGFPLMVVAVGLGLGGILHGSPVVYDVLRPVGAAYLLYLAYRIATAPAASSEVRPRKPLSVLQAALFQWVNPKAWVMVVGAVVTYARFSGAYLLQVLVIALIFLVFGTPCTSGWLWIGVSLKKVLTRPAHFRTFNVCMAILLVVSVIPIFGEIYRGYAS